MTVREIDETADETLGKKCVLFQTLQGHLPFLLPPHEADHLKHECYLPH